ncbi:TPT-domain-containing protein [Hypoxylon rubiginosum]|uniref:TPT-domain-containing protein n=1 Tax=Hypoxylon rubiginosum TaxID=110542 RepID=A0ACB9Z714_9PEZI|nr:TPT-domain-containing protein [Hypoxylon rubiginosum]
MSASTSSRTGLHPIFYIASWIFFSNLTILFNKWLIDDAGFPVILTWWHMTFTTLATQVLARTTSILDGRHKIKMTPRLYLRAVIPIGVLYSGSMVTSTLVYLYLSVPFIQMLKAAAPVVTLLVGWLWDVEHPTWSKFFYIMIIVLGVVMASAGEIHFSWPGFVYQVAGILFESVRIIMIQSLVSSEGLNMDPLVSLYYYAPVGAVTNFVLSLASGWSSFEWTHAVEVGFWMLLLNAVVAFLLNVFSVCLIGKTSGLILVLTGILKNILLVITAVAIWGTPIASLQLIGYTLALFGLLLYRSGWNETKSTLTYPFQYIYKNTRLPPFPRKPWLAVAAFVISLLLFVAWTREGHKHSGQSSATDTIEGVDRLSSGWLTWIHVKDGKWWVGSK